jgi:hemerythrin-like domain-containing protein
MMNERSAGATVLAHLAADHARLDDLFDDASSEVGAGDFARARARFASFADGLERHIAMEERVLFPLFDARAGMPGPTLVMRREHRQIEQLLALAAAALAVGDGATYAAEAASLAAILQAHNMKEERILYPRTDALLDDDERAELVAALERG